jgi:predicted nucleic acid-binding protein
VPTSDSLVYLDSSAIVKLAIDEPESSALRAYLLVWPKQASCALARVEAIRAVAPSGSDAVIRAAAVLDRLYLLDLSDSLLRAAAVIGPTISRSLDAIHLAAAVELGGSLSRFVTYDVRLASAARSHGFTVVAPGTA